MYIYDPKQSENFHEAGLLKLNCDKALADLKWIPVLDFKQTAQLTAEWYKTFYAGKKDIFDLTNHQIDRFILAAGEKNLSWTS